MHPINHSNFGTLGITAVFNNGTSVVNGYVVKQTGTDKFLVSDRVSVTKTCTLAQTSSDATSLPAGVCTMLVTGDTGTGANLSAKYEATAALVQNTGHGYVVNDTVVLASGQGTVTVSTVNGSGGVTAVSGLALATAATTIPANPIGQTSTTGTGTAVTFNLVWDLNQVTIVAGGTGYQTGETLIFSGLVASTAPSAHVSTVNGSGAITAITTDSHGASITTAAATVGVGGDQEHIRAIYSTMLETVEGHAFSWSRTANGSAKVVRTGP